MVYKYSDGVNFLSQLHHSNCQAGKLQGRESRPDAALIIVMASM